MQCFLIIQPKGTTYNVKNKNISKNLKYWAQDRTLWNSMNNFSVRRKLPMYMHKLGSIRYDSIDRLGLTDMLMFT